MNVMFLIGNVGRDPEIRTTTGGSKVATFSIATTERWKDKDGERQERTTWHNCVVWGPLVNVVEDYVHKGSKIAVQGRMEVRKYTNSNDEERTAHETVVANLELLSPKKGGHDNDDDNDDDKPRRRRTVGKTAAKDGGYDLDDDLAF
jgi:single-strand DNA-binding protein